MARGKQEVARARRRRRWSAACIPPSSLEAREGEEDAPAPVGRMGWGGPASPGRQVRFSDFFSIFLF